MTRPRDPRAALAYALEALAVGETGLAQAALRDALDEGGRPPLFPHGHDGCAICASDCDVVLDLRRRVKALEDEILRVGHEAREARELRDRAVEMIDARFPVEDGAAA